MCRVSALATGNKGGKKDISVTCKDSDKPIVHSDKYGMFCEDRCDRLYNIVLHHSLSLFLSPLTWRVVAGILVALAFIGVYYE